MKASTPTPARRYGRCVALTLAAIGLSATVSAQTLLTDSFAGNSFDTGLWTFGTNPVSVATGSATTSGGRISIANTVTTANARTVLVSNATNINPFTSPLQMTLTGISLFADPVVNGNSSLFAFMGRHPSDTGAALTMQRAGDYSSGGAYGVGGGIGISLIAYENGTFRLQVLDSGSSVAVKQAQIILSNAPTDLSLTIDGSTSTWQLAVTGATFTGLGTNQLAANYTTGTGTASGSFYNFNSTSLTLNGTSPLVSHFAFGVSNGSLAVDAGAVAGFDAISVGAPIPEPSTYAAIFGAVVGAFVIYRRRRQA